MPRKAIIFLFALLLAAGACSKNGANTNTASTTAPPTNPDVKNTEGFTPLMQAARIGDLEGAKRSLASGANVNAANEHGVTALFITAGLGNTELTRLLIDKGANINAKTDGGFTPLMQAAMTGQVHIVRLLAEAGADPTPVDTITKKNAADYAPEDKRKEVAEILKISPTQSGAGKPSSGNEPKGAGPKK